jgi:nucleoside-diphosphate-sugar epimerase
MNSRGGVILVVGGAGYVGSVLVSELLERGFPVRVFDRLYYGDQGLAAVRDRIELVVGDMRQMDPAVLDGVSAVINLGGLSNDPTAEYNPTANYEMNTIATIALAELCQRHDVRRYLFGSSCSIYDVGVADEDRDVLLGEDAEVNPRAAYSTSKYEAERALLAMTNGNFVPVILRKGTIYGFSPRMRYDLVVNTFVKDALSKGCMTIHYGGEMWRPLVEVRDVARAYVQLLAAKEELVAGQIFNLAYRNYRISELALRVQAALAQVGVKVEILSDYQYKGVRSYRVLTTKLQRALGYVPQIAVEDSARHMVQEIRRNGLTDFENPRYYNIRWLELMEQARWVLGSPTSVFESPGGLKQEGQTARVTSTLRNV